MTEEEFMEFVHPEPNSGCWLWDDGRTCEYGFLLVNEVKIPAHRYSYMLFVGDIPDGWHVCHKCDVKKCVNPYHLVAAIPQVNALDRAIKARLRLVPDAYIGRQDRGEVPVYKYKRASENYIKFERGDWSEGLAILEKLKVLFPS